jgi:hypothetical protein
MFMRWLSTLFVLTFAWLHPVDVRAQTDAMRAEAAVGYE